MPLTYAHPRFLRRFGGFLQRKDSSALEAEVRLEVLGDLADETLEGELADE